VIRVEFKLNMPGRTTWNGAWSGDDRNYTLVREVDDVVAAKLDGRTWSYGWNDGWRARICACVVPADMQLAKSDGFCGYDWMVESILWYDAIYADHERPGASP
jgi:hypothetical protein